MSYRKEFPGSFFSIKTKKILLMCIIFIGIFILTYSMGTIIVEYWYISVPFIVTCLFIAYFSYRHKRNRIFIILDTKNKQEIYINKSGLNPLKKSRLTKDYKMWLLRGVNIEKIKLINKQPHPNFDVGFCLFCYMCTPIILIISMMSVLYVPSQYYESMFLILIIISIILYFIFRKISINKGYKMIDSEINQILFEEETGYKPLDNGKFTLKYKIWLKQLYYRNI